MDPLSPPAPRSIPDQPALCALLLLAAALAAYFPALQGQFLWDDTYLVGANPLFKSPLFALEVFRHHLFLDSTSLYYRPVQNLTYILDYWIWNREPFGYHFANVLYHALAGFLLFRVLTRLVPQLIPADLPARRWIPLAVAGLWVVHPIHNAAVAYIAGRADSLAAIFALGAWLLVLRVQDRPFKGSALGPCAGALACALLALASKEIALTWMALILLWTWAFDPHRNLRRSVALTAGVLIALALYFWLRSLPDPRPGPATAETPWPLRILLMLRAIGDYVSLIFHPDNLRMERLVYNPAAHLSPAHWAANARLEYLSLLGAGSIAAAVALCVHGGPGRKLRVFGVCWFVIGFAPVSNLFPLNAQVAEHWIYMPSAGLLLLLAGSFPLLPARAQRITVPVLAAFALALTARTAARSADWSDPESFFLRTVADGGGSPRILNNLVDLYATRGELDRAGTLARKAIEKFPTFSPLRRNLEIIHARQSNAAPVPPGRLPTPADLENIVAHDWWRYDAWLALGQLRARNGDTEGALDALKMAARLDIHAPEPRALIQRLEKAGP